VNQNKYNFAGFAATNLSMVGEDLRTARRIEQVMLQPKTSQMLNVNV